MIHLNQAPRLPPPFLSYNKNYTPSRPLWEVKSCLAQLVVRWVTTCEAITSPCNSLDFS